MQTRQRLPQDLTQSVLSRLRRRQLDFLRSDYVDPLIEDAITVVAEMQRKIIVLAPKAPATKAPVLGEVDSETGSVTWAGDQQ